MKRRLSLALLLLAIGPMARSQSPDVEATILQLEKAGREAALTNDIAATDRQLSEDWINVNADGTVTTKPQILAILRDKPLRLDSIDNDEVKVRVYPGTAVVTGRATLKRQREDGETIVRQVRFTRVYVDTGSGYRVVSAQSTPIASP